MQLKWRLIYKYIIDLIYPNRCPCCNKFIRWNAYVCDECIDKMSIKDDEYCIKCGKKKENCLCNLGLSFDRVYMVTDYLDTSKLGIYALKDSKNTNFAKYCGIQLGKKILAAKDADADCIVYVPMKSRKKRKRGYNQAEIIADSIRYVIGSPVEKNALRKNNKVKDLTQHSLNAEERFENAERMFISGKADVVGKKIILCDDVMTTGYTLNKCSEILKKNGAKTVIAAVAATTGKRKEENKNEHN
jgi:competence protein ComFC